MDDDTNRQLAQGRTYSGIVTQDNARVHMGDVHSYGNTSTHNYIYYLDPSPSQRLSLPLPFLGHENASAETGMVSLKRKLVSNEDEYPRKLNKEESLQHALIKLGKFSNSIQHQRAEDVKKIARRIMRALNAVKQQAGLTKAFHPRETFTNHDEDDFENIENCLVVAKRVDVNTGFRRTRHTKLTRVVRRCDKVNFEKWKISLRTSIFTYRNEDGTETIESLFALYLDPRFSGSGSHVTAHFGETKIHTGVSFINPVILAYRIVPTNAEVFKLVRNDDFAGLIKLLAGGKATLRDCDEGGTTLLHHACFNGSIECCQYLVDEGADIERIAMINYVSEELRDETPLSLCSYFIDYRQDTRRRNSPHCGKILLKSGADPTFTTDRTLPPVYLAINFSPTLLDAILVEGISFLDVKSLGPDHESLWFAACYFARLTTPSTLKKLIDAGCDIAKKDNNGWNCLFHSILSPRNPDASYEVEKLQYLLSIFDDIYARDKNGRTVFYYVDHFQDDDLGSYSRDLWYCALDRAGIDVSSHLAQNPRVPSYRVKKSSEYTPEHYHALRHLQSWDEDNFRSQMDRLLQEIPLDEDEALEMERLRQERLEMMCYDEESEGDDQSEMSWQSEMDDRLEGNDQSEGNEESLLDFT